MKVDNCPYGGKEATMCAIRQTLGFAGKNSAVFTTECQRCGQEVIAFKKDGEQYTDAVGMDCIYWLKLNTKVN